MISFAGSLLSVYDFMAHVIITYRVWEAWFLRCKVSVQIVFVRRIQYLNYPSFDAAASVLPIAPSDLAADLAADLDLAAVAHHARHYSRPQSQSTAAAHHYAPRHSCQRP